MISSDCTPLSAYVFHVHDLCTTTSGSLLSFLRVAVASVVIAGAFAVVHRPLPHAWPDVQELARVQPGALGHITLEAELARIAANRRA